MPRAKPSYLSGGAWHLTHRCHNPDYLLKFQRDRTRWRHWLFEARKRYGLTVLNYMVTSNHVHLLVQDRRLGAIARSMRLISGRVAQEFNQRKARKGAFWEDRYFATAVSTDHHLVRCLVYIDLNMVRAGVVQRPEQWRDSGYREIQTPPKRYRIIDVGALCRLTGFTTADTLRRHHRRWVMEALRSETLEREPKWTEDVAVGPDSFKARFC
ncbi:transposase [Elongatibacter sediminis]|uniref:Transposase n=1 Tax=Elongatibacter sediminis TaxID=3119006 RepID=A0AAW9RAM9_9GAMM